MLVSAPASSARRSSTRKQVLLHPGSSPPWGPSTLRRTGLEFPELPLHLEIPEEVEEARGVADSESIARGLRQARTLEPADHEANGGLTDGELTRQLPHGE